MIAVIQRVLKGVVVIESQVHSEIGYGYIVFLGIFDGDLPQYSEKVIDKLVNLRIMSDDEGKMNRSILETKGEMLVVSQFTLCADLSAGRRPSFIKAMNPKQAEKMYEAFVQKLKDKGIVVKTGKFGADMKVELINDGPVTIVMDSKQL